MNWENVTLEKKIFEILNISIFFLSLSPPEIKGSIAKKSRFLKFVIEKLDSHLFQNQSQD